MYIGVQGRLVRPQPVDDGAIRGLCAALCGRYANLRRVVLGHSRQGAEIPALVLSAPPIERRVLMVATHPTALYILRLCEEMGAHLRADLPLCQVPLRRALTGRQVWFVPLSYDVTYHSTAGRAELQPLAQKCGGFCHKTPPLTALCRCVSFCHAVVVEGGEETIGCYGDDPQSRLMAQVLSAVSGFAVVPPSAESDFASWFVRTCQRPALSVRLDTHNDFDSYYAALREALLLATLF